jgi:hypothetical protein
VLKTIKAMQIEQVRLEDLRPGMITLHGLVVGVARNTFATVQGDVLVEEDQTVPVLGRVTDEVLAITRQAMDG